MNLRDRLQERLDLEKATWLLRPADDWASLVARRSSPRPGWLRPLARRAWDRAMAAAMERGRREQVLELTVLPLWWCENESEEDACDWSSRLCLVDDEGQVVDDVALTEGALQVRARLRCTKIDLSFVAASDASAVGIPEVERFPPFALVNSRVRLVVDDVIASQAVTPIAMPTHLVPPFSSLVSPGFAVDDLDAGARALLERVIAQNSFIPPDTGEPSA